MTLEYTDELADRICALLVEGESIYQIVKRPGMPSARTVYRWLESHPSFQAGYRFAREQQADRLFAEILEIADDSRGDVDADGKPVWEKVNRSRLRVDARKWIASKLLPHKYGDNVKVEHAGALDTAPPTADELLELAKRIAFLMESVRQAHLEGEIEEVPEVIKPFLPSGASRPERIEMTQTLPPRASPPPAGLPAAPPRRSQRPPVESVDADAELAQRLELAQNRRRDNYVPPRGSEPPRVLGRPLRWPR